MDRASGVTVSWTGGDPNGYIVVSGINRINTGITSVAAAFSCTARPSAGSFTVPPSILLALPATSEGATDFGGLSIAAYGAPTRFQANGLDWGIATTENSISTEVSYR